MKAAVVRLIAIQVFHHACMTGFRMAAPLLALRQGHTPVAIGVLLALFALTQVFLSLPAGRYADRHGLKRPVTISVAASVLGAAVAVVWPVFPMLCITALLTGGASGLVIIATQRYAGRLATSQLQVKQVFSWLAIGPSLSNFVGPFLVGLMIDHAGFRAAFVLLAVFPVIAWVLVRPILELQPQQSEEETDKRHVWDLLSEPKMRRLLLINWILQSCWDVHSFVLPLLGHQRGFSASVIGTIIGAFAIAATTIRFFLPIIAARMQEWVVIVVALTATGVLFGVYPMLRTPLSMGLCSVLLGFSLGSVQPMIMSSLHQITPTDRQGEALGLRLITVNASSVLMPMIFGTAGTIVGVTSVFWVVGVTVLGGIRAAWMLRKRF